MLKALAGNIVMLKECVMMSLRNIVSNRLRSFLTALGILIGVCAVIALITTVSAVSGSLSSSFSSMGAGTLMVTVSGSDLKSGMTAEDLAEITAMDMVDGVSPAVSLSARVSRGGEYETGVSVSGKNAYYFRTTEDALKRGRTLNAILNQRSQDMLTANNWNVVQYAVLTHMMAQVSGLKVGELVHVIADCHIYDRHIPAVKAMLEKPGFDAPTFKMDGSITDFYKFTKDSFRMENYRYHEFPFEIPMAI